MISSHGNLERLLEITSKQSAKTNLELIKKAYALIEKEFKNSESQEKKERFQHLVATAEIIADMGLGQVSVVAAMLHHVLNDGIIEKARIEKEFGKEVADIVGGISKFGEFHKLKEGEAEKIIFSVVNDVREIIIILADRIVFMKNINNKDVEYRKKEARDTFSLYAPLAHKLGLNTLKDELEDISFEYLYPKEYEEIKNKVMESKKARENEIKQIKDCLGVELKKQGIAVAVEGRAKHIYGIFNKMRKKNKPFEEIYDINAVRVITNTTKECYEALGLVHSLWKPLPGEFDDYIAKPKPNLYQSIHTAVIGPKNKPLEIQIRTEEMHKIAEYGVASHWTYKGRKKDERMDKKLNLYKQLLEWYKNVKKEEFLDSLNVDFFEGEIYVYTPKGDIIELPEGSTALDFAYFIHSDLGNRCERVVINNEIAALNKELRNGDKVEIITNPKQSPKRHWLSFVKTEKAKKKIRNALEIKAQSEKKDNKTKKTSKILTIGKDNKKIRLAKCCLPVFGDDVVGIGTTKRKISVHRKNCMELEKNKSNEKLINVGWGKDIGDYNVGIRIVARDKPGVFSDVLKKISEANSVLISVNTKTSKNKILTCNLEVNVKNYKTIEKLLESIARVDGLIEVTRA